MRKKVFISGVTGTMGSAGLRYLIKHLDKLDIVTLVRPTKINKKLMAKYESDIEIVWGDLVVYEDVKKALKSVDYILHVAAFVSPQADKNPKLAYKINVGSIENILKAIEELKLYDVKLVNIGTVAETGDRLPPIHWGRTGDPLKPSVFDYYATSKIEAERLVIESGLKYWVSLRQTGILHYKLLSIMEGIMFHQPLNNVLEWISEEDSGRLLCNLVIKDLDDDFYQKIYNIGGGENCRLNNYDFMTKILGAIGVNNIEKVFEPNWFATRNFHGQYYLDSDKLNDILDFRTESFDDFIVRLKANIKFPINLLKLLPNIVIKNLIMKRISQSESGPLGWLKNNETKKIDAFFGSKAKWLEIKDWKHFFIDDYYDQILILDHGYNEEKSIIEININDLRTAAKFRGGKLISKTFQSEDFNKKLTWRCYFNHEFEASPNLVLKGGHWCPVCAAPPWDYSKIAKHNPFFAQVYFKD